MSSKNKITATKEEAKPAVVPKLRFPEFQDGPKWLQHELGSIASILKGKGISKADLDPNGSQACIRYGELYTRYGETIRQAVSRTKVPASELFLSKPDDVIIPSSGETKIDIAKASCVLAGDIALGGDLNVIRSKLNGTFLSYYLNGPKRRDIAKVAQGDTVVHLYPHQLAALCIAIPSPAEQQKIADCLSSVDELIAAQARKVDALKTHKKGLMQQLFPREGETQPRLRLPEFANEVEWVPKPLGSFCKVGDIDHKMPPSVASGIPYVMTGDFFGTNGIDFVRAKKISIQDYERLSKKIKPEIGDIVIARYASVGAVRYIETDIKFLVSYSCATIKCNEAEDSHFIYYFLQSDALQSKITLEVNMSSQKNIGIDSIKRLTVLLPNLPEQQEIAGSLADLDALITAETQKLEALKTHKKGLMQQLFPSPEAAEA